MIKERLNKIIGELFEVRPETIKGDYSLQEMGVDSLIFIRLVVMLENEFSIEFDDEALLIERFEKINDLQQYIQDKLENS